MRANTVEGILSHLQSQGECLVWPGALTIDGYGIVSLRCKPLRVHRIAWQHRWGLIPKNKQLDHLCRNRACANVAHLELVTLRENVLRGVGAPAVNARKTLAVCGHKFNYVDKRGGRICYECMLARKRNWYRKRKEAKVVG